jgi:hypothetical protein
MAHKAIYLAVPLGTATGPEWRIVISGWPDGYKIFYNAAQTAELAVRSGNNGLLQHRSGEVMTLAEIANALGETAGWCEAVLFPALARLGEGHWEEETWRCTSSMAAYTLGWQQEQKLLLPAPERVQRGRKPKYFRALTSAERQRYCRTKELPADVLEYVTKTRHEMSHNSQLNYETHSRQSIERVEKNSCHEITNINKEINSNDTAVKFVTTASILPSEVIVAISALPAEHQQDILTVAQMANASSEIIAKCIRRLGAKLNSKNSKAIDTPGGWLRVAIQRVATSEGVANQIKARREADVETQRQAEAAAMGRERMGELHRKAQLQKIWESLEPTQSAEIKAEAVERCRQIGATLPAIVQATITNIVDERFYGPGTAKPYNAVEGEAMQTSSDILKALPYLP